MSQRRKNPLYQSRTEILAYIRTMHTNMRKFVGALEEYGRNAVPPLSEKDVHMIADVLDDMAEDGKFVKRYFGIS